MWCRPGVTSLFLKRHLPKLVILVPLLLVVALLPACAGPPEAEIEADATSGRAPVSVTFTNNSRNADEFHWDFGGGSTIATRAVAEPVVHEYTKAGTHTVTLTAIKKGEPTETSAMTLTITVKHGALDSVGLSPEAVELTAGQSQKFTAEAVDAYDNPIPGAQLTWEVAAGAGTIASDGRLTAGTKPGRFGNGVTVIATLNADSAKSTASVTLKPGPLHRVQLSPSAVGLEIGESQQFTAEAVDAYDNPIPEAQLTWQVAAGTGTITSDGRLTAGTKAGRFGDGVTVTATLNAASAQSTASVTLKPGPLHRVTLSPETAGLRYGQGRQFTAEAVDAYDNRIPEAQLTWEVAAGAGMITSDGMFTAGTEGGIFDAAIVVTAESKGHSASATAAVAIGDWFMTYVGMNTEALPYNDIRIRRAVSLCIDRDELIGWVRDTYANNAQKVLSLVSPTELKASISPNRDIDSARQLMREAGYPDGFSATPLYVSSGLVGLAERLAAYLADAGINTDIIPVDNPDLSNLPKVLKSWGYWGYLFLTDTSVDWGNTPELLGRLLLSTGDENFTGFGNSIFDSHFNAGSFDEAEDFYFDGFGAVAPLYWSMSSPTPQPAPSQHMLLGLHTPQVDGTKATIDGVTGIWTTRIHWDWGDGFSEDAWFPASHTYEESGTYTVTVTAYGSSGAKVSATTTVTVVPTASIPLDGVLDQSNDPPWTGAWVQIWPPPGHQQSIVVEYPVLVAVEVAVLTGNAGAGDDILTLTIVGDDEQEIATSTKHVDDGFEGWLLFTFPEGVDVPVGKMILIRLERTDKPTFGWKYSGNTYAYGDLYFMGEPQLSDFLFRTYGTTR